MRAAVLWFLPMALATFTEKDDCNRTCGNMSVPLPFGLDESCARNSDFVLTCNHTSAPPRLVLGINLSVFNISVENGTMIVDNYRAYNCYDQSGHPLNGSLTRTWITVSEDGPYTFSDTRNKLTVFGCDTSARISDAAGTFGSGCFSYCREDIDFKAESACSGLGCCQTSIPKSLRSLNISMNSSTNYQSVRNFSSCGSAFVVDQESFNVSDYKLPVPADMRLHTYSKIVLDWVVQRDMTCKEARLNKSSYACGDNSFCSYFTNGQGYRCVCEAGYTGNPYGSRGCEGTEIQGTLGYIDLEYLTTGMITIKSDVYSFGAVLVELLIGKKPTSFITKSGESINIIHYFISSVKDKTLSDVIKLEDASEEEMERVGMVAEMAVKCLDQSGAKRPTMREVAEELARVNHELDSLTVEEKNEVTKCKVDEENFYSHATSITCEMSQHGTSSSIF
ncbi:hypothetical protein NL676_013526 [Syzygium grande]|nr:hypothetical protein NL676_013526 [Syzygium grande]